MLRFSVLLLCLAPPFQDSDLEDQVRRLVEQVKVDDLQASDEATRGIIALGEPALPALKAILLKESGDTKLRLEEAVDAINRNIRRQKAMGTPVLVTIRAEARPLAEVLEEVKKQSGQPLAFKDLPEEPVTVTLDKVPYWEAINTVCKAHGGVMWSVGTTETEITKGPYVERPRVVRGNLLISFQRLTISSNLQLDAQNSYHNMNLQGVVAWTAGSTPGTITLNVERMEDDKETSLVQRDRGVMSIDQGRNPDPKAISRPVNQYCYVMPDDAATKLAILKGAVTVRYILATKKLWSLPNPAASVGRSFEVAPYNIALESFNVNGRSVAASVRVSQAGRRWDSSVVAQDFCLVAKDGKTISMGGYITSRSIGGNTSSSTFQLNATVPDKCEITALELITASDTEEIPIGFEFKDLPIK